MGGKNNHIWHSLQKEIREFKKLFWPRIHSMAAFWPGFSVFYHFTNKAKNEVMGPYRGLFE
jgi:hypothetical protein